MIEKLQTIVQEGDDPFSYSLFEAIARNESSLLERVRRGSRTNWRDMAFRKTKRVQSEGDVDLTKMSELQGREADFLLNVSHRAFPRAYGYFHGKVQADDLFDGEDGVWVTSLVRDWVEGKSLKELVESRGSLTLEETVDYAAQMADGLEYVHEKKLLFRDLKPSNVILQADTQSSRDTYGQLKLTDLDGLGNDYAGKGIGGSTVGVITHDWHHPIQAIQATKETDFFALGTTLYYLATGRQADIEFDKGEAWLSDEDMESLAEELRHEQGGPELARLIGALTHKEAEERYSSIDDVAHDLNQIQEIIDHGYDSFDEEFRAIKTPLYKKIGSSIAAKLGPMVDGFKEMVKNPVGAGMTLCAAVAIPTYFIVSSFLQVQSANRAIHFTPEEAHAANTHPVVRASAQGANLANKVGSLYVQLSGDDRPNDVVLLNEIKEIVRDAEVAKRSIAQASRAAGVFQKPLRDVVAAGSSVRGAYRHRASDNTHTEESCSTDSEGNETCSTYEVYDDTDHYWTLLPENLRRGSIAYFATVENMKAAKPQLILTNKFRLGEAPYKDDLGRVIKDSRKYLAAHNEWLSSGPTQGWNGVWDVRRLVSTKANLLRDYNTGFRRGYPGRKHVNNTCADGQRGCDERSAPAGYIVTKRAGQAADSYNAYNNTLIGPLTRMPSAIDKMTIELGKVVKDLNDGDHIGAKDFRRSADKATELMLAIVPGSQYAPPTAAEQTWKPIVWSGGLGGAAGLILGIGMSRRRRHHYW